MQSDKVDVSDQSNGSIPLDASVHSDSSHSKSDVVNNKSDSISKSGKLI